MTLKQVFIVEDHPIMREALGDLIKSEPGFAVCGSAATGEEALQHLAGVAADLVLIDLALTGMNGIELVRVLRERQPDLRCLVLSGLREATYVRQALGAGARGYVLKGKPEELLEAIQEVSAGGIYLSAALQGKLSGIDR
jgi:DNA-binding NarL/FixJ family response regulator